VAIPADLRLEALTAPLDRTAAETRWRTYLEAHPESAHRDDNRNYGVLIFLIALVGLLAVVLLAVVVEDLRSSSLATPVVSAIGPFCGAVFMLLLVWLFARSLVRTRTRRMTAEVHSRLSRLATDNELDYRSGPLHPDDLAPWSGWRGLSVDRVLSTRSGRRLEVGNYNLLLGSGGMQVGSGGNTRYRGGYVAVGLDRAAPTVVLDERGTRRPFLAGRAPRKQRMDTGTALDKHFRVYSPPETQDVVRRLLTGVAGELSNVRHMSVEVRDGWILCSSRRELVTLDADTWSWVGTIMRATSRLADALEADPRP